MADSVIAPARERSAGGRHRRSRSHAGLWGLALGSIGVVYGDIGTSPLYAFREAITRRLRAASMANSTRATVLGVVSLILWALFIIVTLKYVVILLRADNNGEGGTLTLMALASRAVGRRQGRRHVALLGIISAALFYGDAVITPALSVLSAVEGIDVVTPAFHDYVVPLTVVILLVLFAVQSRGTAKVAALFGPIMVIWFVAIALPGINGSPPIPGCCGRSIPITASISFLHHGIIGLFTLGAVFLAVTGAEALYADLGHFGRGPIQIAWIAIVLPSLALNYLGQGALVLAHPAALENPFFLLYPGLGADSDGGPGDGRDRDREPGGDHRGLFAHQPGHPARAVAALRGPPHLGAAGRPDLHAAGQRAAAGRRAAFGRAVPFVERARFGLWHRRHRHHGRHLHDGVHCHLADVALVAVRRGGADRAVPVHRSTFLSANMLKVVEGGWVPLALGGW